MSQLSALQVMVSRSRGRLDHIEGRLCTVEQELAEARLTLGVAETAGEILKVASEVRREEVRKKVESLVTMAIRSVFGREDYRFEFDIKEKRGQIVARPMLISKFRDEELTASVQDGHGGGLVDVCAFVLQVIVICLVKPSIRRVYVGDESFKHVSGEYLHNVSALLSKLHSMLELQIILVTHKAELAEQADKVFGVSLDENGVTHIKTVSERGRDIL